MRRILAKRIRVAQSWGIFWRRFGRVIGLIGIVGLTVISLYTLFVQVFSIQVIEVIGDPVQVQVDTSKITRNLLLFPSEKVKNQILSEYPHLASVVLEKQFPSTLRVYVRLRQAIAGMQTEAHYYLLDENGVVLADGLDLGQKFPTIVIEYPEPLLPGKIVNNNAVKKSLQFILLYANEASISGVTIDTSGTIRAQTDQSITIFDQDTDISQLGHTLQTLLNRFRMKGTQPATIDLRFEKPVIGF